MTNLASAPPLRLTLPIVKRSLKVALIVGTALNLINQADALMGPQQVIWWKVALTYTVPFLVATYGALSAIRDRQRAEAQGLDA